MTDFSPRYLADYQPPKFSIKTVNLTVELDDHKTLVTNELVIQRLEPHCNELILDGEQLTLKSLQLNEQTVDESLFTINDNKLTISLDHFALDNETFSLAIITEIDPSNNTTLEGLFKSGNAFCTQCEAEGFRRISYYLDRPDVMAVFTTKIIGNKQLFPYLLSNGNKIDSGNLAQGKHFAVWHDPFPKPCYLFALVAGDFDVLTDKFTRKSGKDVALKIFVDKGNLAKTEHAMASLKASMKWDEDTFELEYDLDIYMIVAVDFFNMGAMENKGLNVFNSKFVLADSETATDSDYFNVEAVIAHEYFHNWTGNRVTCRDWFQLSLKEGLTVFRDQQFSADMHSAAVTRIQNVRLLRSHQFAEDAGPMAHPIRPEQVIEMNNFYTLTVYEKGAEVIRMIHTLLGQEKFAQGIKLYFKRFDGMAVTCDDFVDAMADASQVDLSLFKHWYSQSGTPQLEVIESYQAREKILTLTINQHNNNATRDQVLHIPVRVELIDTVNQVNTERLLSLTQATQTWTFTEVAPNPVVALLGNFSAPVKLTHQQSDDALEAIMVHAKDEFCRWDAGQQLLIRYIKSLTLDAQQTLPTRLISAFKHILTADVDKALIAEQLILPTFDELVELIDQVDPLALVTAIKSLQLFLAQGLQDTLLKTYHACAQEEYKNDKKSVAKRALKNVCLSYLALLPEYNALVNEQFDVADNMTDSLAALKISAQNNLNDFDAQMNTFATAWHNTTLVMDKWFMLNGIYNDDSIYQRLNKLLKHPLFSLKNPNRARSLLSAFSQQNPKYFHCESGKGYQFLTDQLILLNEINPQVASRLLTPLMNFKSFDHIRQQLIKAQLQRLYKLPNLSKDLQEKLNAALN
ncbi:MAG: aminopeptidase N [Gammaproteobacteria bacterium]|nr:MAG: aminopeptidase N [Gammaproteobacteria bacterium]